MSEIRLSGTDRKEIAARLKADVNHACQRLYDNGPRNHLGASEIGEKCARRLVYSFRWMHREQFDGRMLRLFDRGHREEASIIEWLRAAGCYVSEFASDGKQYRIMAPGSPHYGGSLDGMAMLPPAYGELPKMLTEFKTHNTKSFVNLVKLGVQLAKPKHYSQMSSYGEIYKLRYGIYFAVNKNDDDIHIEIVELDWELGKANTAKAENIITAPVLPGKIAATSSFQECTYCPMVRICHDNAPVDVNCRSCAFARPDHAAAKWHCGHWQAQIPDEAIPLACPQWKEFGK